MQDSSSPTYLQCGGELGTKASIARATPLVSLRLSCLRPTTSASTFAGIQQRQCRVRAISARDRIRLVHERYPVRRHLRAARHIQLARDTQKALPVHRRTTRFWHHVICVCRCKQFASDSPLSFRQRCPSTTQDIPEHYGQAMLCGFCQGDIILVAHRGRRHIECQTGRFCVRTERVDE